MPNDHWSDEFLFGRTYGLQMLPFLTLKLYFNLCYITVFVQIKLIEFTLFICDIRTHVHAHCALCSYLCRPCIRKYMWPTCGLGIKSLEHDFAARTLRAHVHMHICVQRFVWHKQICKPMWPKSSPSQHCRLYKDIVGKHLSA